MTTAALCRVCLRGVPEVKLVRSADTRGFFTDIVRLVDIPETVVLCVWCLVSVRRAMVLFENAVYAEPLLRWIHSALREGQMIDENLISNARSLQKTINSLTIMRNAEHIAIGETAVLAEETDAKDYSDNAQHFIADELECNSGESVINNFNLTETICSDNQPTVANEKVEKENIEDNFKQNVSILDTSFGSKNKKKRHLKGSERDCDEIPVCRKSTNEDSHFDVVFLSSEDQLRALEELKKSEKYQKAKYRCEFCGRVFLMEAVLNRHMERHEESFGPFKCVVCTLRFATNEVLLHHALAHRRNFRCVRCGVIIRRRCHCNAHRARCAGTGPSLVCEHCSKMFIDSYSLRQHRSAVHLRERSFACDFCNKGFTHKQKLLVHLRCHTGERPFPCDKCNKTFATNSNMKAHAATHDSAQPSHYCVECDAYFRTAKGLKRHFDESTKHRNKNSLRHLCAHCPVSFTSGKRLAAHVDFVHFGRSDNYCSVCGKPFSSPGNLRKHVQTVHEKVQKPKDKICDICGRGFALRRTLETHMLTHTGVRPHACERCGATFAQRSALYTHTRGVHLGIRRAAARAPIDAPLPNDANLPNDYV